MSSGNALLRVEHLSMRFGGLVAVDDLSFEARRGDITALIGPNGAGKTTVFNCVTGFYKPTAGRIAFAPSAMPTAERIDALTQSPRRGDTDVHLLERMTDHEIARVARVARTFQNIRLFAGMTALENLVVAQHRPLMDASAWSMAGLVGLRRYREAADSARDFAVAWLDRIDLRTRADEPAGALPYGAQRRLEIARAMCARPTLLCLDEPAAGLNARESAELNDLLRKIQEVDKTSILLIEHDMSVVMEISDRVIVLDYGRKIAEGTPAQVRADSAVIAAYLGVEDTEVVAAELEIAT